MELQDWRKEPRKNYSNEFNPPLNSGYLTPHNSGSGQKAALDVDYRMVWAFSGMVTGK
ncbi:hypothetical protein MOV28_005421 [Escherichia coli]|uniref:hypothetical protein n=1 Tax=Escherichia coli TaxID=562 RepID=UPI00131CECDF|nr:hypothetical protein [Escherichia coli]EEQ3771219.1 hypothetical protein [Escherichia coli]EER8433034.1 hypothetical protein [Escherichia coli]EER8999105.1 hypothetical protein [Escherichia coli]EET2186167.1 hypothetical protein [Escherichia coli]EET2286079.1 hypothetical protein [Escherichia coli]